MSHFSKAKLKINNREFLLDSLKEMGLTPQIHEQPVELVSYYGAKSPAHIVIPREQIQGFKWNDVGFYQNDEGYELVGDDMDPIEQFRTRLISTYSKNVISHQAKVLAQKTGKKVTVDHRYNPDGTETYSLNLQQELMRL
jgi:hypothetical protein